MSFYELWYNELWISLYQSKSCITSTLLMIIYQKLSLCYYFVKVPLVIPTILSVFLSPGLCSYRHQPLSPVLSSQPARRSEAGSHKRVCRLRERDRKGRTSARHPLTFSDTHAHTYAHTHTHTHTHTQTHTHRHTTHTFSVVKVIRSELWHRDWQQWNEILKMQPEPRGRYFTSLFRGYNKQKTLSRAILEGYTPEKTTRVIFGRQKQVFWLRPQDIYCSVCGDWNRELFWAKTLCFSNPQQAFFVLKPKTVWEEKNSTFLSS